MDHFNTLFVLLTFASATAAHATSAGPECPKSLEVAETLIGPPPGYTSYRDGNPPAAANSVTAKLPLRNIMFSDGPPNEQAWLAPDDSNKTYSAWKFESPHDSAIWISCAYSGTELMISAQLAKTITFCKIIMDKSGAATKDLNCH